MAEAEGDILLPHRERFTQTCTIRGKTRCGFAMDLGEGERKAFVGQTDAWHVYLQDFCVGHRSQLGGVVNAIAIASLFIVFPSDTASEAWSLLTRF